MPCVICLILLFSLRAVAQPTCNPPEGGTAWAWMMLGGEANTPSGCGTATIPAGRKFIFLSYYAQFYDYVQAYSYVTHSTLIKVNGTTVFSDTAPMTLATADYCIDDDRTCYRIVDKIVDVTAFTAEADATLEISVAVDELPPLGQPGHSTQVEKAVSIAFKPRFLLTDTPQQFRPRNSDSGDPAASSCNSGPDCYPILEARMAEGGFDVKIGFELSDVSAHPGVSTNYGSGTDPDYLIDPALNIGLSPVSGPAGSVTYETDDATYSAYLMVSSLDYGGTAKLRAYFVNPENNSKIYAEVVTDIEEPGDALPRPYARLPYDEDEDGMADGWESLIGNLVPSADQDRLLTGDSTVGDGLAAAEEYRGFHYLDRNGGTPQVKWTSTDPMSVLDLFIWDYNGLFHNDLALFTTQYPFISLREVSDATSAQLDNNPPAQYSLAKRLNKNSSSAYLVFPLLLTNFNLGGNCDPSLGPVSATLARAPGNPRPGDKGYGPDGRDIQIDDSNLNLCATNLQFPQSAWREILISHEIGHNLGLSHPTQYRTHESILFSSNFSLLQGLSIDKYAADPTPAAQTPNNQFYTTLRDYYYPLAGQGDVRMAERVNPGAGQLATNPFGLCGSFFTNLSHPRQSIHCHQVQNSLTTTPLIVVETSLFNDPPTNSTVNVMNWTPRLDSSYHSTSAWSFSSTDKSQLTCVRRCPPQ